MRRLGLVLKPIEPCQIPDRGLDMVNLLLAASGSAYGTFIPVYLTAHAWGQARIGEVLAFNTIAAMICQSPAGLLIDLVGPRRRLVLSLAVLTMGATPLLIVFAPSAIPVVIALLLQAMASSLLTPAVAAISLSLCGRTWFSERLGRNGRYGSIGAALGALIMGTCIELGWQNASFIIAGALTVPTLWAIRMIGADRVHLLRHGIGSHPNHKPPPGHPGWRGLLRERRLLIFAMCVAFFSLASAGLLQIAAVGINARMGARSGPVLAAMVIVPQLVVIWISPAIARAVEIYGRRPLLLAAFATLPLHAGLFAVIRNGYALIPIQTLEGAGGAIYGVLLSLVSDDLTRRTGYYTLCLSMLGLASGLGAAMSSTLAGRVADAAGRPAAFIALTVCGVLAFAFAALAMPETKVPEAAIPAEPR